MNDERTTPYGMWRYGNDFRKAALAVLEHHGTRGFMPFYFLVGQSIELFLKAYLLGRSMPLKELASRKYGHNLEALSAKARQLHLDSEIKLAVIDYAVLRLLNFEYSARRFQYIRTGTVSIPDTKFLLQLMDKLSVGLEAFCRKATRF